MALPKQEKPCPRHSLGAATANVVGRLSREFAKDQSNFVYSFASPNYETDGE